jgi:rubredoxin
LAKNNDIEAARFWDSIDGQAKQMILSTIAKQFQLDLECNLESFEGLPEKHRYHIINYYHQVIEPQKGKQQKKYDGTIEEKLPKEYECPRCRAPCIQTQDKRGIHWKCTNCGWDTERPFDFSKEGRESHIVRCAQLIKDMFPMMNIVRNFSYNPDAILTGILEEGITNYDLGVYHFGSKLQRLRVERNQHISQQQFMETEHDIYVIGRKELVEKLADKDGIVVHFLLNETKKPIGMSRLKIIRDNCPQKIDKFGNIQYAIPQQLRSLIVTFDKKEMRRLITADFFEKIYENIGVF